MGAVQRSQPSRGGRYIALLTAISMVIGVFATPAAGAADQPEQLSLREVRPWDAKDFGATRPVGIAYDSEQRQFLVASSGQAGTLISVVGPAWDRVGGAVLTDVTNPSTLVYDPSSASLRSVEKENLISVDAASVSGRTAGESTPLRGAHLTGPVAATYDTERSSLVVVDAGDAHAIAGDGHVEELGDMGDLEEGDLVAHNPEDGFLYVLRSDRLDAIDSDGETVATYDIGGLEFVSPQAMTFAPSTASTDDPNRHHLYVADAGDGTSAGWVMEATLQQAPPMTVQNVERASLIRSVPTHLWSPPSTDPSGITWNPNTDRLIVVDSEVEETPYFGDANLWEITRTGAVARHGSTYYGRRDPATYSEEPTGVDIDPVTNTLFITDDSGNVGRPVNVVRPGPDGLFGTRDDEVHKILMADETGATDTEDPVFDSSSGHLFVLSGADKVIHEMAPVDGDFFNGATRVRSIGLTHLGPEDFEGLTMSPTKGTLFVGARATDEIFEIEKDGDLVRKIDVDVGQRFISGLAWAPSSTDPNVASLWIADRNRDEQLDGMLFEISVSDLGAVGVQNQAPTVDAGPNRTVTMPDEASLRGSADDDGLPNDQLTVTWSKQSGPGNVTFADPNAAQTTANFSEPGEYILRLTADDGELTASDTMRVRVNPPPPTEPPPADPPPADPPPGDPSPSDPPPDDSQPEPPPPDAVIPPEVEAATDWFSDDNRSVFEADINAIATAGITRGCNPPVNDRYCPDGQVTRGQMAAFLVRALDLTDAGGDDRFGDVRGHVFEADINAIAAAAMTRGCNPPLNDRFCPDDQLTRGQMAAFLARALGYSAGTDGEFLDVAGHVFAADIAALAEAGITRGCNPPANDRFCPDDTVTRGQMAAFLARALIYGR